MVEIAKSHVSRRGIDLPMAGEPSQRVEDSRPANTVALLPLDYMGLKPRLKVQVGDAVRRGQPLFEDRKNPKVRFTSPGAGNVVAVHRGERRAILSVVVALEDEESVESTEVPEVSYQAYAGKLPAQLSPAQITQLLCESGLWTAFRSRPFGPVPEPGGPLHALFVTAMDSHPLAPDVLRAKVYSQQRGSERVQPRLRDIRSCTNATPQGIRPAAHCAIPDRVDRGASGRPPTLTPPEASLLLEAP